MRNPDLSNMSYSGLHRYKAWVNRTRTGHDRADEVARIDRELLDGSPSCPMPGTDRRLGAWKTYLRNKWTQKKKND